MSSFMIKNAIAGVLAVGTFTANTTTHADPMPMSNIKGMERCYGIAKAYANDCGTEAHNCAGEAKTDGDKTEFVLVPTGLCNKIVGGKTQAR